MNTESTCVIRIEAALPWDDYYFMVYDRSTNVLIAQCATVEEAFRIALDRTVAADNTRLRAALIE